MTCRSVGHQVRRAMTDGPRTRMSVSVSDSRSRQVDILTSDVIALADGTRVCRARRWHWVGGTCDDSAP